jgi:hypothetical protein
MTERKKAVRYSQRALFDRVDSEQCEHAAKVVAELDAVLHEDVLAEKQCPGEDE